MPVTLVTGDLATDTINQSQRVPDMDEAIAELDPNEAPLVALTKKLRRKPAIAPKVEWLEHEPMPRFDVLSATAASNATSLPITNGNYFRVGDLIRNTNSGAAFEVTATASGNITVGAALGSVTPVAHASGDEIFIVGNLNAEGSGLREIKTPKLANQSNFCEIVRHPYGVTGTEAATKLFGGPDLPYQKAQAAIEHMRAWEQIALTGAKSENTTTAGKPKRTAGGLIEFVQTNVTSVGGALTEAAFQQFLRGGFRYGSGGAFQDTKLLLASPLALQAIEGYARSTMRVDNQNGNGANAFGIKMQRYVSGQGEVLLVREPWLADSATYKGYMFLIDLDSIEYRPLRETKHLEDRQSPDTDKMENEWLTEATFVFKHERRFAVAKGITG
jgi:hypothetical protein